MTRKSSYSPLTSPPGSSPPSQHQASSFSVSTTSVNHAVQAATNASGATGLTSSSSVNSSVVPASSTSSSSPMDHGSKKGQKFQAAQLQTQQTQPKTRESSNHDNLATVSSTLIHSFNNISLSTNSCLKQISVRAKVHPFTGAVLTPQHARELTPTLVLLLIQALSKRALETKPLPNQNNTQFLLSRDNSISPKSSQSSLQAYADLNQDAVNRHSTPHAEDGNSIHSFSPLPLFSHIHYTVWITEAWNILKWAEPSASLFWEMATMYHTLYLAERSSFHQSTHAPEILLQMQQQQLQQQSSFHLHPRNHHSSSQSNNPQIQSQQMNNHRMYIPHIVTVDSNTSFESQDTITQSYNYTTTNTSKRDKVATSNSGRATPDSPGSSVSLSPTARSSLKHFGQHENNRNTAANLSAPTNNNIVSSSSMSSTNMTHSQLQNQTMGSAKQLPLWLIGMFMLVHCEDQVFWRSVCGGDDERRFSTTHSPNHYPMNSTNNSNNNSSSNGNSHIQHTVTSGYSHSTTSTTTAGTTSTHNSNNTNTHPIASGGGNSTVREFWKDGDFVGLLTNSTLSPRTRMHAGHYTDGAHCATFLLRHLRKFLILSAIPQNSDALAALTILTQNSSFCDAEFNQSRSKPTTLSTPTSDSHSTRNQVHGLQKKHNEEHGDIGTRIRLTKEDLDRLSFFLQYPSGGYMDETPLNIVDLLSSFSHSDFTTSGGVKLEDVEIQVRKQLEKELQEDVSVFSEEKENKESSIVADIKKLSLRTENSSSGTVSEDKQGLKHRHKMCRYANLRYATILRKHDDPPRAQLAMTTNTLTHNSSSSNTTSDFSVRGGRLHDIIISGCSDAHIYLLQPFEHVTVSACINCTIVIGAVAGLLHVVDCERTRITVAARRVIVSNCCDVLHCIFTPNKPLLAGDNRSCQFAPYNTYYDGLREDLMATGLAAAKVVPEYSTESIGANTHTTQLLLARNMWKYPEDLAKLDITQVVAHHSQNTVTALSSPPHGAETVRGNSDDTMQTPILLPAAEFHILFVPIQYDVCELSDATSPADDASNVLGFSSLNGNNVNGHTSTQESPYCRYLADVLQQSPFRLPAEYERQAVTKVDKVRSLHQAAQTLSSAKKSSLEDELNRMFRDWLVSSGNLRQLLDLVHMECDDFK